MATKLSVPENLERLKADRDRHLKASEAHQQVALVTEQLIQRLEELLSVDTSLPNNGKPSKPAGAGKRSPKVAKDVLAPSDARGAKTAAIRDYLASNPTAKPKEVVAALETAGWQGIKTSLVSVLKSKLGSDAPSTGRGAKSAAVRDYLKDNPNAKPKDVIAALSAAGYTDIKSSLVSVIKSKMKGEPLKSDGNGRPGRTAGPNSLPVVVKKILGLAKFKRTGAGFADLAEEVHKSDYKYTGSKPPKEGIATALRSAVQGLMSKGEVERDKENKTYRLVA